MKTYINKDGIKLELKQKGEIKMTKMTKIKESSWVETNPFEDPDKANNGGGYSQPLIIGTVGEVSFELHDTSCGDFGSRASLKLGGFFAQYDYIGCDYEYTSIPRKYFYLVDAINEAYNTSFITKKRSWTEKFEDKKNYTLEALMPDYLYYQSIDRDEAVWSGKALYDYYCLIDNETGQKEIVTAEQMETWAASW